jgi:predicted alpha/beta hydrolase
MSLRVDVRIDSGLRLHARDGFRLAATLYEPAPENDRNAAVLINSATAVPRGYYDAYARYLAGEGFSVLTYDYRGIGGSRPKSLRGFRARMIEWCEEDQAGMIDWIGAHLRPRHLLVVGHSVGGQMVGLASNNNRIDALLTVAAQNGYMGHWPEQGRWKLALRWYLVSLVSRVFSYVPGWMGTKEDLPGGVAREWAAWCRRPGFLFQGHEERRRGFQRFAKPILAYGFEDDPYAPRLAVETLLREYRNAPVTHRQVHPREAGAPEIGHFGFFRERFRGTLWRESAEWLLARIGVVKEAEPAVQAPRVKTAA